MVNDNYPPGCSEASINREYEFSDWIDDHEDVLLVEFLDYYSETVVIPAVKNWTEPITKLWNGFCEKRWQEQCEEGEIDADAE